MKYRFSIINDERITNGKAGIIGEVDKQVSAPSLEVFGKAACRFHICCAITDNKKRNNSSFKYIDFLQFDFDCGDTPENVALMFSKYDFIILASKNHMNDKGDGKGIIPRFHILLPLKKEITKTEVYKTAINFYFSILIDSGFTPDKNAKDAVRYFYRHKEIIKINKTGKCIDDNINYETMMEQKILINASKVIKEYSTSEIKDAEELMAKLKRTKYWKQWNFKVPGDRFAKFLQFLGVCRAIGASRHLVINVLDEISIYSNDKSDQYTKSKIHSFIERNYK